MVCFGCVGLFGMAVNLGVYNALIAKGGRSGDLQFVALASAIAVVVSNAGNYVVNNFWTFHDKRRTGLRFLSGYGSYFLCSFLAMAGTVILVSLATRYLTPILFHTRSIPNNRWGYLAANGYQASAVLVGSLLSFKLNLNMTWGRDADEPEITELKLHEHGKPAERHVVPAHAPVLRPRAYPKA